MQMILLLPLALLCLANGLREAPIPLHLTGGFLSSSDNFETRITVGGTTLAVPQGLSMQEYLQWKEENVTPCIISISNSR